MNIDNKNNTTNSGSGRVWAGIIIIAVGLLLLAGQLNISYLIPSWIRSWQVIMIIIGIAIGGSSGFRNPSSFILIGMGSLFLLQKFVYFNVWKLAFPSAIILLGIWLLMDNRKKKRIIEKLDWKDKNSSKNQDGVNWTGSMHGDEETNTDDPYYNRYERRSNAYEESYSGSTLNDDFLTSTAIFSEEKKIITAKNLQGGEILNIFGGTDINLLQADIQEPIVIDVFQLFAGTKIIVPAHWKVHSKVVSIFGEVDDRRFFQETPKSDKKIIYLKGTSIFGGITIKSM